MASFLRYMSHTFGVAIGLGMGVLMLKDPTLPIRTEVGHLPWWMPLIFITGGFLALAGWWHELKNTN
jgi:hypothetical protein